MNIIVTTEEAQAWARTVPPSCTVEVQGEFVGRGVALRLANAQPYNHSRVVRNANGRWMLLVATAKPAQAVGGE